MSSKRYQLWALIHKVFPPTNKHLQTLSHNERPGLQITLPKSNLQLGRLALEQSQYDRALQYFDAGLMENSANAWAWHGKGDAHQWLDDYKESSLAYEQACVLNPTEGLHWGGRANAQYGLGNIDRALELKEQSLMLNSSLHWMFKEW